MSESSQNLYMKLVASNQFPKEENYWTTKFAGEWQKCAFPYDRKNAQNQYNMTSVEFKFDGDIFSKLMKLSNDSDYRLYMIMTAALAVLINKYTGEKDIVIGSPTLKQDQDGEFINSVLALRNNIDYESMSFKDLLLQVRQTIMEANENQNYPIERLLYQLGLNFSPGENFPLFDIAALVENIHDRKDIRHIHCNILFSFVGNPSTVNGTVEYNSALYDKESIERIVLHYSQLLLEVLADINIKIIDIAILSRKEKERILFEFNGAEGIYPKDKTIHELFEEQAAETPSNIAVVDIDGSSAVTYLELNRKANRLARLLRSKGVKQDTIVGIIIDRSIDLVVGLLGILKAGGAYLAIDKNYPRKRIQYILEDSVVKIIVTKDEPGAGFVSGELIGLEDKETEKSERDNFASISGPMNLVYVIYTSGSTGNPRGVLIRHGGMCNLIQARKKIFGESPDSRMSQVASPGFDAIASEIWPCLLHGASLHIVDDQTRMDPFNMKKWLIKFKITISYQPTVIAMLLLKEKWLGEIVSLRYLLTAGDRLTQYSLPQHPFQLYNLYGPTEDTVWTTWSKVGIGSEQNRVPPIGKPIDNHKVYIVNSAFKLQPIGVPGEIFITGDGLAVGYLNNPERTMEKFIDNPFFSKTSNHSWPKGGLGYCTGDIGQWLPDGNIEFLGRVDHQVKIRGFRIELGEIESRLANKNGIKDAVVVAREDELRGKYLCAYIVLERELPILEIREYLSGELPNYMIPSGFVVMEKIPLTSSGKVDHRALPTPALESVDVDAFPRDEVEEKLVEIWKQALRLDKVGIRDSYFNIGGDSIKIIKVCSMINEVFHSDLKVADLFNNETVEKLAVRLRGEGSSLWDTEIEAVTSEIKELKVKILGTPEYWKDRIECIDDIEDIYPMSDIEKGMVYHSLREPERAVYHSQIVQQMVYVNFDPERFKKAVDLMVEKHPILRTSFHMDDIEKPMQVVHKKCKSDVIHDDLSGMGRQGQENYIKDYAETDRRLPFNFPVPTLWRLRTFGLDKNRTVFFWSCHHAIIDGWSAASLKTELNNLYLRLAIEPGFVPEKLKCSYRDFIIEQLAYKKKQLVKDYWQQELAEYKRLRFDKDKSPHNEAAVIKTYTSGLGIELMEKLNHVAAQYNTPLKHLCFAAYLYMLNMVNFENDVTAGLVTNNRPLCEDGEKILGCFLNTIPVRIKFLLHITWSDYIRMVDKKLKDLSNYDRLPLFEIVELIGEGGLTQNPVFDTLFNFIDFHVYEDAVRSEVAKNEVTTDSTDIWISSQVSTNTLFDFSIDTTLGGFSLYCNYSNLLISDELAFKLYNYFEKVLHKFIQKPEEIARKDELIPGEEKQKLLYDFNKTTTQYSKDKTMHQLFEEQVEKSPDRIAVIGSTVEMLGAASLQTTYRQLNELSNQLAYGLRKMGVGVGDFVGVVMDRCMEITPAVMGILKAGGAYAPLEPYLPDRRIEKILASLQTKCVISDYSNRLRLETMKTSLEFLNHIISLDKIRNGGFNDNPVGNPAPVARSEDISYVIYTSGSTGMPKGVLETHRPVVNVIEWVNKTFEVGEKDKLLFIASLGFDLSVYDIFGILASGGAICTAGAGDMKEPLKLLDILIKEGITFWDSAPAALQQLVPFFSEVKAEGKITALRLVFLSGDWIPVNMPGILRETFKGVRVISLGGATEATIWSNYYPIGDVDPSWSSIPYGKPIQNAKYYILDTSLNLCPINTAGELYIGGECLAREYKNDLELTAVKFIENFFCPGERLYKTGDMARWFDDGNIQFLGRKDHQVKIRGFRVELGEIENRLTNHPEVKEALVLAHGEERGDKYLCAYIVSHSEFVISDLKEYLSKELPDYMIPSYFMRLEKIPLTPNGKIDRSAISKPELKVGERYTAPRNEIESKLVDIWSGVLSRDELHASQLQRSIGIDDNFFLLGGHSLKATVLASRIHKELNVIVPMAELFKNPTIRDFSKYLSGTVEEIHESIIPVEKKEYYVLSYAQQRIYILQQIDLNSTAYNMPALIPLPGDFDRGKIEGIFIRLIERHESLRTSFHMINDTPVQKIHGLWDQGLANVFGPTFFQKDGPPEAIIKSFIRPFDLTEAPLLRVGLIKDNDESYLLLVDMHHIISDGISSQVLSEDFTALYDGKELPPLRIQYKDFAQWQNNPKEVKRLHRQMLYWLKEFSEEILLLEIPTDYPRPIIQSFEGNSVEFEIPGEEAQILNTVALQGGATLFMALLAAFNILLSKLSGQEEIIIGAPIAGRRHSDLEKIIGMFINTLAFRNYPIGNRTFKEFLVDIKERVLMAFENQEYPFEVLVDKLSLNRDMRRNPLFDVMFVLQNMNTVSSDANEEYPSEYQNIVQTAKFDLTLTAVEKIRRLFLSFQYCTKLFKKETVERFSIYFKKIISAIVKAPDIRLNEIEIISEEEKRQILCDFNDTKVEYPKDKTIHQLFEEQAEKKPDHVALLGSEGEAKQKRRVKYLSYRQLNEQSGRLAHLFIEKGVLADNIVGIMLERSIEMIIGIFGILKAGGAYLPIDPEYPQERIDYMLKDSSAKLLVTTNDIEGEKARRWEGEKVLLEYIIHNIIHNSNHLSFHHSSFSVHHSNLSYIIYTSGSTGKPKGVMINHGPVINLLFAMQDKSPFTSMDTYLLKTSYIFDVSITELFGWTMGGGRLAILEKNGEKDPQVITEWLKCHHITHINFVPSMFNAFLDFVTEKNKDRLSGLKYIFLAGEALLPSQVKKFTDLNTSIALENIYGPTEGTVYSSRYSLSSWNGIDNIPIGKPLPNIKLYILNKYNHLQPLGIPGELYIRGGGVARGYLNNPELTAEKFDQDLWDKLDNLDKCGVLRANFHHSSFIIHHSIIYCTGDLARWLPDGNIEFLGRIDHQVKIRGVRVEPGEIESRILNYPGIKEVAALVRDEENGDKYLCAYIVSEKEIEISELREYLAKVLPDYMIPSYFVQLEKIPLTSSGKIDHKSLPGPETKRLNGYIPPSNGIEKKLVELWAEILGKDALHASHLQTSIGTHDNFFQLGGHSLKATSLTAKIHKVFDVKVPLVEIFKMPRIKELANYIKEKSKEYYISLEPVEEKEYYPLSSAQKRLYILTQVNPDSTVYNMPEIIPLPPDFDCVKIEEIFKKLIKRHEILRTSFHLVNDTPVQKIHKHVGLKNVAKVFGLTFFQKGGPLPPGGGSLFRFIQPFDLSQAPLLRVILIKNSDGSYILLVDMHHIISDGTSNNILARDFITLYKGHKLPALRIQYRDFSEWQNKEREKESLKKQKKYWLNQFEGELPLLNLPIDYVRPAVQNFEGSTVNFEIDRQAFDGLKALTLEACATLYMVLLGLYSIFLAKISNQEDIMLGTPAAGRRHADLENTLGIFINTLVLRVYPIGEKTFSCFLQEVKETTLKALENQDYQYEDLVEQVSAVRDASRNPLFDTLLGLQNTGGGSLEIPGLDVVPYEYKMKTAKFDLTLLSMEIKDRLLFIFEYRTQLFKQATVEKFNAYFIKIIGDLLQSRGKDIKIAEIEIISTEEKKQVLFDFNGSETIFPNEKTIPELFADQVAQMPDHISVIGSTVRANQMLSRKLQITYRELYDESGRLAHQLRAAGVQPDVIVAIKSERSLEMIIGLLGILESGGAYLPIDLELTAERISYLLADSGARILLTTINAPGDPFKICFNSAAPQGAGNVRTANRQPATSLAYIIYTSGSTGKPKGVMTTHYNVIRVIRNTNYIILDPHDRVLQLSNYAFDGSVFDIYGSLLNGATSVLLPEGKSVTVEILTEVIKKEKITVFFVTTALFNLLVDEAIAIFSGIQKVLFEGERVSFGHAKQAFQYLGKDKIIHVYGPTETTVYATHYPIDQIDEQAVTIPIGQPLSNTSVYILDKYLNPVPIGVAADLYIGGWGTARGYLNHPELTSERFIKHKLATTNYQSPIYKTGDLVRWLADGNIEFLGRIDFQVKIRGFRVELGEIESRLTKYPGLKETVVMVREEMKGDKYLCAYIVFEKEYVLSELREYLAKELPDYMIPSYFVPLKKIPLTPNGKIDRLALPKPEQESSENYTAPRNQIEKELVEIWSEILGNNAQPVSQRQAMIGIDDNFFEWGGHSLKATLLASRIHKELNINIPLTEIFKNQTIRGLSECIKNISRVKYESIEPVEKKAYHAMSSAQKRLYILQQMNRESTAYNIPQIILLGIETDSAKIENTIKQLLKRHESFRTSFHMINDEPVQAIHEQINFEIEYFDSSIDRDKIGSVIENFIRPFALSQAPLLRAGLIKDYENQFILMVDMHHIISDGVSHAVLKEDFISLYNGKTPSPLRIQYKDYSEWQNSAEQQERIKKQEEYWLNEFPGEVPVLTLPLDYPRPLVQNFAGNSVNFNLNEKEIAALKNLAKLSGTTLYMVILSVYNIFLAKLTGQEDIIVGTPIAARRHHDLERIIGMFVNTLAIRNFPLGSKTFYEFLLEVKTRTTAAYENQEYQFEDLVDKLIVRRNTGRNPIFDVLFNFLEQDNIEIDFPASEKEHCLDHFVKKAAKFDLTLKVLNKNEKLLFNLEYNIGLFKHETVKRLIGYFKQILTRIIAGPFEKIADIEIISEETRQEKLNYFNEDLKETFEIKPIQVRLADILSKYRAKTAIEYGTARITYAELEHRAACISKWLAVNNIKRESFIGIYIADKIDIISAILGTLDRACIFVPLDTALPIKRIENMIRVANIQIILTDAGHETILSGMNAQNHTITHIPVIKDSFYRAYDLENNLAENKIWPTRYDANDKVYVYFTSGTTGVPNAIVGKNESLVQFLEWQIDTFRIDETYRISQFAAVGFDAFLRDMFIPLFVGGTICIPDTPDMVRDSRKLVDWIDGSRINLIHCVPSLFHIINSETLTDTKFRYLKYILLAGEPLYPNELKRWYRIFNDRIQLVNYYGATEITMAKSFHLVGRKDTEVDRISAGRAMKGARIIILDQYKKICEPGITGEIYFRTAYCTHGYLDNPELNAHQFIKNPFSRDKVDFIYKTGDLGRKLANGEIEVLERIDRQVKIRGVRIELENIENCLCKHDKIERPIVISLKNENNESYLCAYIVYKKQEFRSGSGIPTTSELRAFLANELPEYMIPSYFIPLKSVPLTPNGKIDTKALPEPDCTSKVDYIPPGNDSEKKLIAIWSEVLGKDRLQVSKLRESISITSNFFDLGGNSLKATIITSRIYKAFDVQVPLLELFKTPTIKSIAEYIGYIAQATATRDKFFAIEPVEKKEYYTLSSAQKRLYILHQFEPTNTAYNMPNILSLEENINKNALEQTFRKLIARHESLRTSFEIIEGIPVQRVQDEVAFEIEFYESQVTDVNGMYKCEANFIRPFDLSRAPLLRVGLFYNPVSSQEGNIQGEYIMVIDRHHIISDGISQDILIRDFISLYAGQDLPPLSIMYKEYSEWQQKAEVQNALAQQEKYWLKEFAERVPALSLPTDYPRPPVQSFEGNSTHFELNEEEKRRLNEIAYSHGATLFMVSAALYFIFLAKLNNQEDIVVGIPTAGRRHADLEKIVGMFVNTLALRNYPSGYKTFRDFLSEVKENALRAFENQDYPFEDLVEKVEVERDRSRNPLFDVMFMFQNFFDMEGASSIDSIFEKGTGGLKIKPYPYEKRTSKFDLTLIVVASANKLHFTFEFCTKLFKKETIERFIKYFAKIVSSVIENPVKKLAKIEIITTEEKQRILYDFNNTAKEYPKHKTLHQLIEEQLKEAQDHIAIIGSSVGVMQLMPLEKVNAVLSYNVQITYKELDEKAGRLAYLLKQKGAQPDTIVGIMIERSLEMIIGILGILKAGAAYLPIDPEYPEERISYMLKDSGATIILGRAGARKSEKAEKKNFEIIFIDSLESSNLLASDSSKLAYLIYTSGSTGKPKGVMVEHRGVVNFIKGITDIIPFSTGDVVLSLTTFSFDIFALESIVPLTKGSKVIVGAGEEQLNVKVLARSIARNDVNILQVTPSRLSVLIYDEQFAGQLKLLKYLLVGGEALPENLLAKTLELREGKIYNLYGPTETTIWSTVKEVGRGNRLDIGKPIANTQIYILDKNDNPQPVGVPGELYISGDGVARGYLNNPELTLARFYPSFSPRRLYKTGDLARWLPDGNIEFLERTDRQLKIRGFRIEAGEIENRLANHKDIEEAVVVVNENNDGDKYLCVYFVSIKAAGNKPNDTELRQYLSLTLPGYMVPSYFIPLEKIPLTPNGKLDRKALPKPATGGISSEYAAPSDVIEEKLVNIWAEVLGIASEKIGTRHNFFELGGTSLHLIRQLSKIYEKFGIELTISQVYQNPKIQDIAKCIKSNQYVDEALIKLSEEGTNIIFGFPPALAFGAAYRDLAALLNEYSVYSFNFIEDENRLNRYVDIITDLQVVGPYILFGYSAAGILIYEVTKALENKGFNVSDIIFFDCLFLEKELRIWGREKKAAYYEEINKNLEKLGAVFLKEKVIKKIENYLTYYENITHLESINANIHLILSDDKKEPGSFKGWDKLTTKTVLTYQGAGKHAEMLMPGFLEKNVEIARKILAGCFPPFPSKGIS